MVSFQLPLTIRPAPEGAGRAEEDSRPAGAWCWPGGLGEAWCWPGGLGDGPKGCRRPVGPTWLAGQGSRSSWFAFARNTLTLCHTRATRELPPGVSWPCSCAGAFILPLTGPAACPGSWAGRVVGGLGRGGAGVTGSGLVRPPGVAAGRSRLGYQAIADRPARNPVPRCSTSYPSRQSTWPACPTKSPARSSRHSGWKIRYDLTTRIAACRITLAAEIIDASRAPAGKPCPVRPSHRRNQRRGLSVWCPQRGTRNRGKRADQRLSAGRSAVTAAGAGPATSTAPLNPPHA